MALPRCRRVCSVLESGGQAHSQTLPECTSCRIRNRFAVSMALAAEKHHVTNAINNNNITLVSFVMIEETISKQT